MSKLRPMMKRGELPLDDGTTEATTVAKGTVAAGRETTTEVDPVF